MNLQERKQQCRTAWQNEYAFLKKDSFAKIAGGNYTIGNCNKTTYIEGIPDTKHL